MEEFLGAEAEVEERGGGEGADEGGEHGEYAEGGRKWNRRGCESDGFTTERTPTQGTKGNLPVVKLKGVGEVDLPRRLLGTDVVKCFYQGCVVFAIADCYTDVLTILGKTFFWRAILDKYVVICQ